LIIIAPLTFLLSVISARVILEVVMVILEYQRISPFSREKTCRYVSEDSEGLDK